jgi:peptidyl-prolyl cis-trans isomerase C
MTKMRISILFGIIPFLLLLAGCQNREEEVKKDEIVATVDGMVITVTDFTTALERATRSIPGDEIIDDERAQTMKINILNQIIEKKILTAEAHDMGIIVSDKEIDQEVADIIGEYPDSETFEEHTKELNIDIDQWRSEIEYNLLLKKLIAAVATTDTIITPEEAEEYYREHQEDYNRPTMVWTLQIMVETKDEAEKILALIESGEDFSNLAKTYSISPDGKNGGDLGYFGRDEMPPDFEIVFDMKPGTTSDVVESPYGFHIFKVVDRKEAKDMTLDEARPEIEKLLKDKKMEEEYINWFSEIIGKYKIEINPVVLEGILL